MNIDKQRIVAHTIVKAALMDGLKNRGDLADAAAELIAEFGRGGGDSSLKIYPDDELRVFTYALVDRTPPIAETTET